MIGDYLSRHQEGPVIPFEKVCGSLWNDIGQTMLDMPIAQKSVRSPNFAIPFNVCDPVFAYTARSFVPLTATRANLSKGHGARL